MGLFPGLRATEKQREVLAAVCWSETPSYACLAGIRPAGFVGWADEGEARDAGVDGEKKGGVASPSIRWDPHRVWCCVTAIYVTLFDEVRKEKPSHAWVGRIFIGVTDDRCGLSAVAARPVLFPLSCLIP